MFYKVTPELEDLFEHTLKLRQVLTPVLPPDAVNYIISLVAQDSAHRKYLKLIEPEAVSENAE